MLKYSDFDRFFLKTLIFMCFVILYLYPTAVVAQVTILRPVPHPVSSPFGLRDGRLHAGTDYASPVGTQPVVTPGYIGGPDYRPIDGNAAGRRLHLNYECGIRVSYFHLSSYSGGSPPVFYTGTSGSSGDGAYAAHLHFEIRIGGVPVDPESAFGLDLCDDTIRSCLLTDANGRGNGAIERGADNGVCGGGGTPYSGPPPLIPPTDGSPPPLDPGPPTSRPPITPPTYSPPANTGGPETGVGPPAGGPVLWDSSEYTVSGLTTYACDRNVFITMRGRAAMEAQEDIITSEIVVHRPDSVMEYTCANEFIGFTAERAGPLFSENQTWNGRTFSLSIAGSVDIFVHLDPMSLDQVLEATVTETIYNYVSQQFPLEFLGDTAAGLDTDITGGTIGGASYTCTKMADVWRVAKCENFGDSSFFTGSGPFYTFAELIEEDDPRTQYVECGDTGLIDIDLDVMTNDGFAHHGFDPATLPGINIHRYYDGDPANYTGGNCTGLDPVATGITVITVVDPGDVAENIIEYEEHFCVQPGCSYDYTSDTCVK